MKIGQRFGRLTVLGAIESSARCKIPRWLCKCDCGKQLVVKENMLLKGSTKSCGCYAREMLAKGRKLRKKPNRNTRLYKTWMNIRQRCNNPKAENAKYYYSKGIAVCKEWDDDFDSFYSWAINNGYKDGLTIDRIDNERGYSPDNCRWITSKKQCNNRTNNVIIQFNNEKHTLSEWSEILGIKYMTLYSRIERGWDIERAFTTT